MDEVLEENEINEEEARRILTEIKEDLEERGYDSIKQIAGYLISGDPGFISNYKNCRTRIVKIDRTSLIEELLYSYLVWNT